MVKRVRIGGATAEKSEMPIIKPQLAFLKPKGEANCGLSEAMLSALQRWFVSGHVDRWHLNCRPQHDVRPFFRVNHVKTDMTTTRAMTATWIHRIRPPLWRSCALQRSRG